MPEAPTIVKLGGSVITRKRAERRVRRKVLALLSAQLAAASSPLVVLHGAGSFGHPSAKRFRLSEPPGQGDGRERRRGAAIVGQEVRQLHQAVLAGLIDAGGSPLSVPAYPIARNSQGRLGELDAAAFRETLASGSIPVSFGDVVRDDAWGFSILSADTIAVRLARDLGAVRVLFVSDVEGVMALDRDGRSRLAPVVDAALVERLAPGPTGVDVTGGIRGKIAAMREIANGGVDAGLISGLRDGALLRAIRGETVYGSWARPSPG